MGSSMTPPGLPAPQGTPASVLQQAPQSRQQLAEDVAPIPPSAEELDVAALGGFKFSIDLTKPSPGASPSASAKPTASPKPTPTPSPSPTPSASSSPGAWKGKPTPTPTPSGPRIDAKVTIYPDGTQKPPGDEDSNDERRAPLLKVVLDPSVDVALPSLGAFVFTIPQSEDKEERGYTVALYETRKFHKDRFIDAQLDATSDDGVVRALHAKEAHKLLKGHLYTVILFGDPLPQTPGPYSPPQYPGAPMQYNPQPQQPGYTPQPGMPQQPGLQPQPGFPQQPGFVTPTPYPTPFR